MANASGDFCRVVIAGAIEDGDTDMLASTIERDIGGASHIVIDMLAVTKCGGPAIGALVRFCVRHVIDTGPPVNIVFVADGIVLQGLAIARCRTLATLRSS